MAFLGIVLFCLVGIYYAINFILEVAGRRAIRQELHAGMVKEGARLPAISVVIPAYNEEKDIVNTVKVVLCQKYPKLDVIVVDDGSKDRTLLALKEAFVLEPEYATYKSFAASKPIAALFRSKVSPNLRVVQKENGGKSDAINAGLNLASNEYICVLDADVILEQHALFYGIQPFVQKREKNVVAVGEISGYVTGASLHREK